MVSDALGSAFKVAGVSGQPVSGCTRIVDALFQVLRLGVERSRVLPAIIDSFVDSQSESRRVLVDPGLFALANRLQSSTAIAAIQRICDINEA